MASKKKAAKKKKPVRKVTVPEVTITSKPIMVAKAKPTPRKGPSRLSGKSRSLDPWDR